MKAERVELGKSYVEVAHWVKDEIGKYWDTVPKTLVMDATGVGSAMVDLLREMEIDATIVPVVVTGGNGAGYTSGPHGVRVSRTELLTKLQTSVEQAKFVVLKTCKDAPALLRELLTMRMEGKAQGEQDDLAFATALVVWWGVR